MTPFSHIYYKPYLHLQDSDLIGLAYNKNKTKTAKT